ncbi:MAG: CBS domain-containing protein [Candidatus Micrarchaeota archaeon]|nr:CBS domain-containing protein [Candidatus Micrarchaeota archaeon]
MKVREIMKQPVTMKPGETVSRFISLMEKHHIHEVPVVSRGRLVGMLHYKDLAARSIQDPTRMKIEALLSVPPTVSPEDDVMKAAETIFFSKYRAVPVVEGEKLVGIVSSTDIVKSVKDTFRGRVEDIMSPAIIIREDEDIGKARVLMREKNISRLPVLDSEGRIVGMVTVFDLLRAIKPRERLNWYSMAAEKLTVMNIPVSVVMNKNPPVISKDERLSRVPELMEKYRVSGLIVSDGFGAVGVITTRDLLELFLSAKSDRKPCIQVSGVPDEERERVMKLLENAARKISSMHKLLYLHLHVKTYGKKFSVRLRVKTDSGVVVSRSHSWDLLEAVGDAVDQAERMMVKTKEKLRDVIRRKLRSLRIW